MKKKLTSGAGWSFEPAGANNQPIPVHSLPPGEQRARVAVEKRPKGKVATTLSGFVLADADRKALAKELKNACGAGGTDKDGAIEVQGDHADAVRSFLTARGWRVK